MSFTQILRVGISAVFIMATLVGQAAQWSETKPLNTDAFTEEEHDYGVAIASGNNTIVATWFRHASAVANTFEVARSIDNGITWSAPQTILTNATLRYQFPIYVGEGDWSILDLQEKQVFRSTDDGQTWGAAESMVIPDISEPGGPASYRQIIAGNEAGILLMAYTPPFDEQSPDEQALILRSVDGGKSWAKTAEIPPVKQPNSNRGGLVHCSGSTWLAVTIGNDVYQSDDNGDTWTELESSNFPHGPGPILLSSDHNETLVATRITVDNPTTNSYTINTHIT